MKKMMTIEHRTSHRNTKKKKINICYLTVGIPESVNVMELANLNCTHCEDRDSR